MVLPDVDLRILVRVLVPRRSALGPNNKVFIRRYISRDYYLHLEDVYSGEYIWLGADVGDMDTEGGRRDGDGGRGRTVE